MVRRSERCRRITDGTGVGGAGYRGRMDTTLVETQDGPSGAAMALATAIILGGTTYLALRYKRPIIRAATPLALTIGVRPLAKALTRLGVV